MVKQLSTSLYWKLSSIFLVLLSLVGAVYIGLTLYQSEMYFAETNQKLNATLAEHIASEVQPFVDGKPNLDAMDDIFHDVMVVNPSVEVYLLDSLGTILSFSAPPEKIKRSHVSLGPIREFLSSEGKRFVLGDNPRDLSKPKVFSAAEVTMNRMVYGYIYVILAGEEYDSVADRIVNSHILTLGLRALLLSLAGAGLIGLVALALVTRKLRRMTRIVSLFKEGEYGRRVEIRSSDELDRLGAAFNEMADRIERNVDELRRNDQLRRELIANVSHDLRTPLASMQGYIETILMKDDFLSDQERKEYLRRILGSTERLSKLIQELFELSKLEAKETKLHREPFALPELMNDLALKFAPQAERRGVSLSTVIPKSIPLVVGDLGLIERVLQNLVDNAIKNTPSGGAVTVEVDKVGEERVRTAVVDTGVGIPKDQIPFIFDRFFQTRNTASSSGAGLGLAIVKKILEAHGESITVISHLNKGTRFEFNLPAAASN